MKKIILYLFVVFSLSFSFAGSDVGASVSNVLPHLQTLIQFLYLIFWPFLVLGGKLVSNSFVYGSSFGIDVILWKLWQVIRVFANYMIGFIFLFSIFVYFFKGESALSWKKIFPKVVVAAILVNASWFLLGAMIDVSTILTVTAQSLAGKISNTFFKDDSSSVVLPIKLSLDTPGDMVSLSIEGKDYHPCVFPINTGDNKVEDKPGNPPCFTYFGGVYKIYKDKNSNGEIVDTKKVKDAIELKASSVGMFFYLFKYLNSSFVNINKYSSGTTLMMFVIKLILFFILIVPFIVLVIILFIRILILWVVIPFSPVILGAYVLGIAKGEIAGKFKDIISLIFQPAYVMFMLSLGFIFMQAVSLMIPSNSSDTKKNTIENVFGLKSDKAKNELTIGTTQFFYPKKLQNGTTKDMSSIDDFLQYFSWFIANLLAGFIMWSLVFTALKSNKFTASIAGAVDTYAKKTVETAPILPGGQSVESLRQVYRNVPERILSGIKSKQYLELTKDVKNAWNGKDKDKEEDDKGEESKNK